MDFNRRDLVLGACAASACAPTQSERAEEDAMDATAAARSVPDLIDAHTHVFNASDLSIEKFISVVVLRNYTEGQMQAGCKKPIPAEGLARLIKKVATALAPSAEKELANIDNDEFDASVDPDFAIADGDSPAQDAEAFRRYEDGLITSLDEMLRGDGEFDAVVPARELDDAMKVEVGAEFDLTLAERVRQILRGDGPIGRYLAWAYWLTRSRNRIIKRYKSLYANEVESRCATIPGDWPKPSSFVGLEVDYGCWLGEEPHSPFAQQFQAMAALKRKRHSELQIFLSFDPLRQALVERGYDTWSPLERLSSNWPHFQGVKLYPPMGFMPIGNAAMNADQFPSHVRDTWRRVAPGVPIGAALDAALEKFFVWAVKNDVPVMTHSGNSVDAGCGFAARGSPQNWERLLRSRFIDPQAEPGTPTQLEMRTLRLCLGHFESVENFNTNPSSSWGGVKLRLISDSDFPNLYTDLSYTEEFTHEASQELDNLRFLRAIARANPTASKLMFGTDWIMFDREACREQYFAHFARLFERAGFRPGALDNFAYQNARRWLKLAAA